MAPSLPIRAGRERRLSIGRSFALVVTGVVAVLICWLGIGGLLYTAGQPEMCLKVTPFHAAARMERLKTLTEPEELRAEAERILRLNGKCPLAYSALANAAYTSGDALAMIEAPELELPEEYLAVPLPAAGERCK